jgi:hypothetical protein
MNQASYKDADLWRQATISSCETHHIIGSKPCYGQRFEIVLKFHEPGYAPVKDSTGSYHIDIWGNPPYKQRFIKAFGFYEGYAAVETEAGCFHIVPQGDPAYEERYSWCGNFQEGLCSVRDRFGKYFHINTQGKRPYNQTYCYVGDFKDGIAVVCRKDGKSTHIDKQGNLIHSCWHKQLDVFHKGFARAKDEKGWFHVKKDGMPAYPNRFISLEPFYNGQAHGEDVEGNLLIIDEQGQTIKKIFSPQQNLVGNLSGDLVGFWKSETIRLAVKLGILDDLPGQLKEIGRKVDIPLPNLERLLRALWEIGIVHKKGGRWSLTRKGSLLAPCNRSFIAAAALMWPQVQEAWQRLKDKLLTPEIHHHPTFKEETIDENSLKIYRCALKGYAQEDFHKIATWPLWKEHSIILGLGQTAITVLPHILRAYSSLNAIILNEDRPLYHVPFEDEFQSRIQQIFANIYKPWDIKADAAILPRFLHYFPDEEACQILRNVHSALSQDGKIYLFEMVLDPKHPKGGLLDLNMLAESGGKLRTWYQWKGLFNRANFYVESCQTVKPHLQFIVGRKL